MWSTFITTITVSLRERTQLFWLFAFPLILASLFFGMFSGLRDNWSIEPQRFTVVQDANWKRTASAQRLIDTLDGGTSSGRLITVSISASRQAARSALDRHATVGYLYARDGGALAMVVSDTTASRADGASSTNSMAITLSVLNNVIDRYNQTLSAGEAIAASNPSLLADANVVGALSSQGSFAKEVSLTNFKPDPFARYYYALLGMACLMSMTFALHAITLAQANLSALGARRTVSPLSKWRQLAAAFCASWLGASISLLVTLSFIRYVCGISVGGREPLAVVAVIIGSFVATSAGTLLGSIPRMPEGTKIGLSTLIATLGSLFAGLYGDFAMRLNDTIQRTAPALHLINPVKQVSDLFYDMLYYDSLAPFMRTFGVLMTMSAVFLIGAVILLRRQRYDHI